MPQNNGFTEEELRDITQLTKSIRAGMQCDGADGDPCLSDRLAMLPLMARYLRLHGYRVEVLR